METLREMIARLKGCGETMSNPWDIVTLWEQNAESLLASADCDLVKKWRAQIYDDSDQYADELETWLAVNLPRIKAEARLEEAKRLWGQDFGDAYNGGYLTEQGRDYVRKRIAELTEEKETR